MIADQLAMDWPLKAIAAGSLRIRSRALAVIQREE
jgi:hypothetical protein